MKKIITHIILILASIIVIDKIFSFFFTELIFKHTFSGESGGTINYVIKHKEKVDYVILGASRAKHGINPNTITTLGKGLNLGINGTNVVNQLLVLDILLKHELSPRYVILQTDLYTYDPSNDERLKVLDQIKRVYPFDTPLIRSYVEGFGIRERIVYFFDTYKYNRKFANILFNYFKKDAEQPNNGYVGLPSLLTPPDEKPLFPDYIYSSTSTNGIALKKMKEIADKENITLILVMGPSYKNVMHNPKEQEQFILDLQKKGFTHIIDLSDIARMPEVAPAKYWRDGTHFSHEGALLFTARLNKELAKIIR